MPGTCRVGKEMPPRTLLLVLLLLMAVSGQGAPVSFVKDLVPILSDQCVTCHEEKKAKGGYRVDTFEALLNTGDSDTPPVVAGKPENSLLYQRLITHDEDERMPQKGDPLPATQIELFRRWLAEGAKFDGASPTALLADLAIKKDAPAPPEKYPRPVPITALQWLPDGKTLAASGYREVILWDADAGKMLKRIPGTSERVLSLSLHPNGKTLAVAGGVPGRAGELLLINIESGELIKRLPNAKDTVLAATFSPDGRLLAVGGAENVLRVFNTGDWKQAWKAEAHADWITSLAFSSDSKHLLTTSRDRTARVFDSEKGTAETTQTGHDNGVVTGVFDKEGKTIITASLGQVRRWAFAGETAGDGSPASKVLKSPRQEVTRLGITSQGLLAANTAGKSYAYDLAKAEAPKEILSLGKRIDSLSVSPDGERVAVGGSQGEITVFRVIDPASKVTWVAAPGL